MADLKRKQLKEFLSGSFGITGSLNVTGSVEFDKNISGSITSTGSFSRLVGDTIWDERRAIQHPGRLRSGFDAGVGLGKKSQRSGDPSCAAAGGRRLSTRASQGRQLLASRLGLRGRLPFAGHAVQLHPCGYPSGNGVLRARSVG